MSVMQRGEVQELALGLVQLLEIQIPEDTDPLEPGIILSALACLFPEQEDQLQEIMNLQQFEQQWNCVLEFIEIKMLDGQRLEVEALGLEEIASIYELLIDYTEQAMQEEGAPYQQEALPARKTVKNQNNFQKEKEKSKAKQNKKKNSQALPQNSKKPDKDNKKNKKIEQKKENKKEVVPVKEKSKEKSQSKGKKKSASNVNNQQNKQTDRHNINNKSQKVSPQKASKAANISSQPLQNQVIKQITAAMKGNIKKAKNKVLLKDPKSTQEVMKAKRQFQHYLGQFKREGKIKVKAQKSKKSGLDQHFLKALEKRQKNIQETVINEQLKYFMTLRDKKVAFINKIHKLTQQLEKQRLIEKQKQQRRLMESQRAKTYNKIQQSNALFNKNMELLKENYKAIRQKNELQEYDQRIICKQMEDCMKKKKFNELQEMKMLWEQQNMKLNNIMGDQQKIKNKLIDIYRKNRPC